MKTLGLKLLLPVLAMNFSGLDVPMIRNTIPLTQKLESTLTLSEPELYQMFQLPFVPLEEEIEDQKKLPPTFDNSFQLPGDHQGSDELPIDLAPADTTEELSGPWTGFDYTRQLRPNYSGEDIQQLRSALHLLGYAVTPSSYLFDETTKHAVLKFQKDHNLDTDGIVGPQTASRLNQLLLENRLSVPQTTIRITQGPTSRFWIVINKTTNTLHFFENQHSIRKYPVATGKNPSYTPEGKFTVVVKVKNPAWGGAGIAKPVPGGDPSNPLGYRWIGLSVGGGSEYGIHGTNAPRSIGTYASLGCVRMLNENVEELFDLVPSGTPVWIGTYEQLKSWGIDDMATD